MVLFEDNNGALMMASTKKIIQHNKHMEIKYFELDWAECDFIILHHISTHSVDLSDLNLSQGAGTMVERICIRQIEDSHDGTTEE